MILYTFLTNREYVYLLFTPRKTNPGSIYVCAKLCFHCVVPNRVQTKKNAAKTANSITQFACMQTNHERNECSMMDDE